MRIEKSSHARGGLVLIGLLSLFQIAIGFFLILGTSNKAEQNNPAALEYTQEEKVTRPAFKLSFLYNEKHQ